MAAAAETPAAISEVDVEAILSGEAAKAGQDLNWRTSIVDLMKLLGIDSSQTAHARREQVWARLASDLRPRHLAQMARRVQFVELPGVFDDFLKGRIQGRVVVEVGGD